MSLGLLRAGFDVRLAFDKDAAAIRTYRANIGQHGRVANVRDMHGSELLRELNLAELDLFTGGPPCQGFSKQRRGAHLESDERNGLVREYARLATELRPRAFIFENVQIFGQKRGRELIDYMRDVLNSYNISEHFVCASDFGLAQRRSRFLMIGIRKDVTPQTPELRLNGSYVSVRDVIGELPPPPADYTEHPDYPNHIKCRITALNEERFRHVPPGGGWSAIPISLRLACHNGIDASKGGWPDVYGRLEWDGQCPTLTAGFDSFTRGRYGHPEQNRSLTLREGARIQGFPDSFHFEGTRSDVRLQIGNAVPPPLAEAAASAVREVLQIGENAMPQVRHMVAAE